MIDYKFGIKLNPLDKKYIEKIREWRNDPAIFSWCRQNTLISDATQYDWFYSQNSDKSIKMFAIKPTDPEFFISCINKTVSYSEIVGVCGFTSIDYLNRRAEFSIYIAPEFQFHSLSKPTLKTLIKHGFMDFGFNSIWGETFDGNPASKIFTDIGFVKEGTRREFYFKNGKMIDAHLYSMLRSECTF